MRSTTERRSVAARYSAAHRRERGNPGDIERLGVELAYQQALDHIQRAVNLSPMLTAEQVASLRALIGGDA